MHLIIESGATKSDWYLIQGDRVVKSISLDGLNANYHSIEKIETVVSKACVELHVGAQEVLAITMYSSGASDTAETLFRSVFDQNHDHCTFELHSDLLAAARSAYGRGHGLVGILGTGSNAAYYDGNAIKSKSTNLGFILGDEGGGVHLGKRLIQAYFYDPAMPQTLRKVVENYIISRDELVQRIYPQESKSGVSTYLAGIVRPVLEGHSDSIYLAQLYEDSFFPYLQKYVLPLAVQENRSELRLCGSIADIFQEVIKKCCETLNLSLTSVVRRPIDNLIAYHLNQYNQQDEKSKHQ